MRILGIVNSFESKLIAAGKFIPVTNGKPQLAYHTFFEFCLNGSNKWQLIEYNGATNTVQTVENFKQALKIILNK